MFVQDKDQLSASTSTIALTQPGLPAPPPPPAPPPHATAITPTFVSYKYLELHLIITNRMCLARAISNYGFPRPLELGANRLAWRLDEVEAGIASRPRRTPKCGAKKPQHAANASFKAEGATAG